MITFYYVSTSVFFNVFFPKKDTHFNAIEYITGVFQRICYFVKDMKPLNKSFAIAYMNLLGKSCLINKIPRMLF